MPTALPPLFTIDTAVLKNPVRQVAKLRPSHSLPPVPFARGKTKGLLFSASGEKSEVLAVPFRTKDALARAGRANRMCGDLQPISSVRDVWANCPAEMSPVPAVQKGDAWR